MNCRCGHADWRHAADADGPHAGGCLYGTVHGAGQDAVPRTVAVCGCHYFRARWRPRPGPSQAVLW